MNLIAENDDFRVYIRLSICDFQLPCISRRASVRCVNHVPSPVRPEYDVSTCNASIYE